MGGVATGIPGCNFWAGYGSVLSWSFVVSPFVEKKKRLFLFCCPNLKSEIEVWKLNFKSENFVCYEYKSNALADTEHWQTKKNRH